MRQDVIDLYDRYTHGHMSRRDFFENLTRLAGSSAAAMALLPLLKNDYARAETVAPDDVRLAIDTVIYDADGTGISGYLARLEGGAPKPAIIVIHENRGLNPHIQDVTRRLALEGFLAFAPDMLSADGGTPEDEDRARDMIGALDAEETAARLAAAVPFLAGHEESTGRVGAIGFCWGGGMVNALATRSPDLAAGVAYYGRQAPAEDVPAIEAALLLHYAGIDERINEGIDVYVQALEANGKTFETHIYEGAQHAFNNDTNEARYDADAAQLAWGRTIAFLTAHLNG